MVEERTQRTRRNSKAPSLAPLYGGVVVAILAIIAVALAKKNDQAIEDSKTPAAKEAPSSGNPFSRTTKNKAGSASNPSEPGNPSSPDLLESQTWTDALATAESGVEKLREAREKRDAGDQEGYIDLGIEARALFNKALDDTVQWELDLLEAHGEEDGGIQKIQKERAKWSKHRKELRHVDISRR